MKLFPATSPAPAFAFPGVLLLALVLLMGCQDGNPVAAELPEELPVVTPDDPGPVFPAPDSLTAIPADGLLKGVVDTDCQSVLAVDPEVLLHHIPITQAMRGRCAPLHPLTAPDGRQLTAQEWRQATGAVTITCTSAGTRYDFSFENLIPGGLYTIWHFTDTGGGALASHAGDIRNIFEADADGAARFSVTGTAGRMTFNGTARACTLPVPERSQAGVLGELFVVVYHKDNRSWGNGPGPEDTTAGHLVFMAR